MGISKFRLFLDETAADKDIQFVIPYTFLPPRFRKIASNRNMLLLLDQNMTIHVRWQGELMSVHCPLTKRATLHLIREVFERMNKYRRQLKTYSDFIDTWSEEPLNNKRYPEDRLIINLCKAENTAVIKNEVQNVSTFVKEVKDISEPVLLSVDGSSPFPEWDW